MVKAIELLKFCEKILKSLSKVGVKTSDYEYIEMYDDYKALVDKGAKKEYVRAVLSEKYNISETTIFRIVSRLEKHIKI